MVENTLTKEKNRDSRRLVNFRFISPVILFFASVVIFGTILAKGYYTDLDSHIYILERHLEIGSFPVPPLYYFSLYFLESVLPAGFFVNAVLILSLSVVWKFCIARKYLLDNIHASFTYRILISYTTLCMMFFFRFIFPALTDHNFTSENLLLPSGIILLQYLPLAFPYCCS